MKIVLICFIVTTFWVGCGKKKEKDEYSKVSVAFGNATTLTLAETKPSALKMRLKYVTLAADRENATAETGYNGNNIGQGAMIWGCTACSTYTKDDDSDAFSISVKTDAEADAAGASYFDLNRTSAEVNAELNSQDAKVLPGTYRYIGVALIGEQQGGNNTYENVKWAYSSGDVAEKAYASFKTEWSAKLDPPLVLENEQSVVVTMSYNLDKVVTTGLSNAEVKDAASGTYQPGKYDDCNTGKTICFNFPDLTVSAKAK